MCRLRPTGAGVVELLPDVRQSTPARQLYVLMFETLKTYSPLHSTLESKAEPAKDLSTAAQEPGVYLLENDSTAYKAVWKGVAKLTVPADTYVVVPDGAKKTGAVRTKLRCHRAKVEAIYDLFTPGPTDTQHTWEDKLRWRKTVETSRNLHKVRGIFTEGPGTFIYREGETATAHKLNPRTDKTCTGGIHLYARKQAAMAHFYRNRV
jgi:hypothetical protein